MKDNYLLQCKCGLRKIIKNDDLEFVRLYEIKQNCNCSGKKFKCPNCGYSVKAKRIRFN